jgi:hypothetical protein
MEEWMYCSLHSQPRYLMEVSEQPHVPAALFPDKESPVHNGQEAR